MSEENTNEVIETLDEASTNMYKEIADWLKSYEPINSWIYFNVIPIKSGSVSVESISGVRYIEEFIDGSKRCELFFSVSLVKSYDDGKSNVNVEANEEFISLNKWVEEQNQDKNYPTISDICIESIEPMNNTPTIARDSNKRLAQYTGQFKMTYIEFRR